MNLSIHLALTLNYLLFYLLGINSHIFLFSNEMSLPSPSLLYSYSKISKLITNPRPEYWEDSSDQNRKYIKKTKKYNKFEF